MVLTALIEMPKDTRYKYEVSKETGNLKLDRVLSVKCPANYGYIPGTLEPDGDALDVFVISEHPIPSMTEVTVVVVAVILCEDQGLPDHKVVAQVEGDPYAVTNEHMMGILQYLKTYKEGFVVKSTITPEEYWSSNE